MRKIYAEQVAYVETIDPQSLNPQTIGAFSELARLLLKNRGGPWKGTTEVAPALDVLYKAFPSLTVDGTIIRRMNSVNFIEAVLFKRMDPSKHAPQNLPITSLIQGTYFGITSQNPQDIMNLSGASSQAQGETHMVFDLGEVPGFETGQLRQLMLDHADILVKAAGDQAEQLRATLASLRRATLKIPNSAILKIVEKMVLRYNDLIGIVDYQVYPNGRYVPKDQFNDFANRMRRMYNQQKQIPEDAPNAPQNFQLDQLKGRNVAMIGTPPRGWSTDRFQTALRPYGTTVTPDLDYNTRYAFYDPKTAPPEKLEQARQRGIKLIPYQSIIPYLSSW